MAGFETWKTIDVAGDEGDIVIRCRAAAPPPMKREKLPHLVMVGWAYEDTARTGMPPADELRQMETFEASVGKALDAAGAGILVASVTGMGAREWRYYTADPDAFMDALNEALDEQPEYPLDFKAFEDPEWGALLDLLED